MNDELFRNAWASCFVPSQPYGGIATLNSSPILPGRQGMVQQVKTELGNANDKVRLLKTTNFIFVK